MNGNQKGEPIVLGELKKEKSSKPVFVFIVLAAIIAMLWYMPQIQDYFNMGTGTLPELYRSTLGKLINGEDAYEEEIEVVQDEPVLLNTNTTLTKLVITISNMSIADNKFTYTITSKVDLNLDNGNYIVEIFNANKESLGTLKLSGEVTSTPSIKTQDVSLKSTSKTYYIRFNK